MITMLRRNRTSAFGEGGVRSLRGHVGPLVDKRPPSPAQTMPTPASDSLKPPEQPFGKGPSTTVYSGSGPTLVVSKSDQPSSAALTVSNSFV